MTTVPPPDPSGNNLRANIQELVSRVDFGVSITRMTDISQGLNSFNFFSSGTMLGNCIGFEVTDSLDSFFKTGKVVLADETALNEIMPLTGNEVLAIRYKNLVSNVASGEKIVYFRIFSISETDNFMNANAKSSSKFIVLNLVEFPAFEMLTLSSVYKSYPNNGAQISTIVYDMLSSIPYMSSYYQLQNVLPTKGTFRFWIPYWTPIKTLKYLQQYAMSQLNEPMYVLRITQDDMSTSSNASKLPSLSYTSIYNILANSTDRKYSTSKAEQKFRNTNVDSTNTQAPEPSPGANTDTNNSPQDVILAKSIISNDAAMSFAGLNGFTMISRDAVHGGASYPMTYQNYMKSYKSLGFYGAYPTDSNKTWGNQWAKYVNIHFGIKEPDIISGYQSNILSRRTMLGAQKALIFCYVNELRKPGERAQLILPSGDPSKIVDFMRSGSYLTWEVTDRVMASGEGVSEIKLVRDSYYLPDGVSGYLPKLNSMDLNLNLNTIQSV